MTPKLPDPNIIAQRVVDRVMDDPLAVIAQSKGYTDMLFELLPTTPWESLIPLPRGLYRRLQLDRFVEPPYKKMK